MPYNTELFKYINNNFKDVALEGTSEENALDWFQTTLYTWLLVNIKTYIKEAPNLQITFLHQFLTEKMIRPLRPAPFW